MQGKAATRHRQEVMLSPNAPLRFAGMTTSDSNRLFLPLVSGFVQGGADARPLEPLRASHAVPLQVPSLSEAERRRRPGLLRSHVSRIHSAATGDDPSVQSSLNIVCYQGETDILAGLNKSICLSVVKLSMIYYKQMIKTFHQDGFGNSNGT